MPGSTVIQVVVAVVDEVQVVLDVAVRAEDERLPRLAAARGRSACWVVIEWSQDSRSGPVTVTTPRCDRSTAASPASSSRCSRIGSP